MSRKIAFPAALAVLGLAAPPDVLAQARVEGATTKVASEDWRTIIDRMITLGASVTPAEQQTLIEYLNGLKK